MEKVNECSDTDGKGGIHILQGAEQMPTDHQQDEDAFDIVDVIISVIGFGGM